MQVIPVLHEDQDILVVNKPPGVVVNRSETIVEETIQDWFMQRLKDTSVGNDWETLVPTDFQNEYGTPQEIFTQRGGVVHRLDKETSGVLILAKNPGALTHLLRQFRLRETHKQYTCLVHGKFHIPEDVIHLPLGRSTTNRTQFAVDVDGRVAETAYKVMAFYSHVDRMRVIAESKNAQDVPRNLSKKLQSAYQGFSLVSCWPKTGRTHQIRVHMKHLHHPIVSDETYLGTKRLSLDVLWCPRLFLHASELQLTHPRTHQQQTFTAPLWPDLLTAQSFLHTS